MPENGVYVTSGRVRWATNPLGTRFMAICVNGQDTGCTVDTDIAVSQYATNDDPGIGTPRADTAVDHDAGQARRR